MRIQMYESEMAMVGPCALCSQLVRVKEHDTVYRLDGMGGMVCGDCAAKEIAEEQAQVVQSADTTEGVPLIIKENNALTTGPCAICGETTEPSIGPELFLE